MAIRPSIQALIDQIEELRQEQTELAQKRADLLRAFRELASRRIELKAQLEHERAKFKKLGWSN